jgi:hypothetical protein
VTSGDGKMFTDKWMRQENAVLVEHRLWEIADMFVAGARACCPH